jgi:hypothetical protein
VTTSVTGTTKPPNFRRCIPAPSLSSPLMTRLRVHRGSFKSTASYPRSTTILQNTIPFPGCSTATQVRSGTRYSPQGAGFYKNSCWRKESSISPALR